MQQACQAHYQDVCVHETPHKGSWAAAPEITPTQSLPLQVWARLQSSLSFCLVQVEAIV